MSATDWEGAGLIPGLHKPGLDLPGVTIGAVENALVLLGGALWPFVTREARRLIVAVRTQT
jgi:hypothetical protein